MSNRNYLKGVYKERKIVNEARAKGLVSFRSAGSHSAIDLCIIDIEHKVIKFVQCKPKSMSKAAKQRLYDSLSKINGTYEVQVSVE